MKRSCQRQTQVFDLPVRRIILIGANTVRASRTISARQTCSCAGVAILREHLQTAAISRLESDGNSDCAAPDSHASSPLGSSGIQMSDAIHWALPRENRIYTIYTFIRRLTSACTVSSEGEAVFCQRPGQFGFFCLQNCNYWAFFQFSCRVS